MIDIKYEYEYEYDVLSMQSVQSLLMYFLDVYALTLSMICMVLSNYIEMVNSETFVTRLSMWQELDTSFLLYQCRIH